MSILVPIDVSAPTRAAVDLATALACARDEDMVLVHASPGPEPAPLGLLAALHELAQPVRNLGVQVRIRVVSGDPVRRICRWGSENAASLIVTGTRGEVDGPEAASSIARGLAACSDIPVVAIRPAPGEQGTRLGPIRLVQPAHAVALDIVDGLASQWGRPVETVGVIGPEGVLDVATTSTAQSLSVVSVPGGAPWPAWCLSLLREGAGAVVVVTRGTAQIADNTRHGTADLAIAR